MVLICIQIFFARIVDVTIGTVRTILTVRGKTFITTILAFFEVLIWFYVAKEALITVFDSFLIPLFYSLGYATGTFLGTIISNYLIDGFVSVQIVSSYKKLPNILRNKGYAVSILALKNDLDNNKNFLFVEVKKSKIKDIIGLIKSVDKKAFLVVNETKYVSNGYIK